MDNQKLELSLRLQATKIRRLVIEQVHNVGIGHLGGSLSVADLLSVLYFDEMKLDPKQPKWGERDRLVMSKGHAGPAVYACLAMKGYFPLEQLKTLNQPHTNLPSHCDMFRTPGIDMTTGSLGQGISCAMGIAMACKADHPDSYVYFVCGDGETQEGEVWEAIMFGGYRKLDHMIGFLDYNHLQIDGRVDDILSLESPAAKYEAFGWYTQTVDGHDVLAIRQAIENAKAQSGKPSMIILNTIKGKGIPEIEDIASNHNYALKDDLYAVAAKRFDEEIQQLEEALACSK